MPHFNEPCGSFWQQVQLGSNVTVVVSASGGSVEAFFEGKASVNMGFYDAPVPGQLHALAVIV